VAHEAIGNAPAEVVPPVEPGRAIVGPGTA